MAVTKIRKISSWTLLISSLISIVVLGFFYMGGVVDPSVEMLEPVYTGMLINWTYILFSVTVVSTILFAFWQFTTLLKQDVKSAIMGFVVLVCFGGLLLITYTMGDDTPLKMLNSDSAIYNTSFWLKVTDMWIYTTYVMLALIVVAVTAGTVKKVLNK